jgi:hypothetical protein
MAVFMVIETRTSTPNIFCMEVFDAENFGSRKYERQDKCFQFLNTRPFERMEQKNGPGKVK